ncbi:unnamed protein product [Cercopithifilaria johnstoni]|uniref:Chondroitin proteoglycan 4 domain-containing protein n=1 Tax=Cercopithifilaria johnstoni TaxID=2874296 RepID=A0A8J2MKG1_9BILA|nr:unnamed protein product [Cercopithifilaria johnstoni]
MQQGTNGRSGNPLEPINSDSEKNSISDLEEMPEFLPNCAEGCLKPFLLTIRASFVSGNNYERLVNTCEKFHEVYECMDRLKKCQPNYFFRIFMDGFEYMCIEHPADCEQKCKAHNLIAGWFIYSAMHSTKLLHTGANGAPPRVNIGFLRKIISEACSIVQCYFLCLKTKYNARCHGIAGNLLMVSLINHFRIQMEVMVRPIYRMHNSMLLSPFWNVMRLMLPSQCNFITADAEISWQRISPKLDKDLKKFYKNRTEPLIKLRPPVHILNFYNFIYIKPENFTELEKSLFRQRTKRNNKEINIETFITVKKRNETRNITRDNIG